MSITHDILKRSRVEGQLLYLPAEQLDRKTYTAVNEVLERIGGKWDRKAKAHIFKSDPQEAIDTYLNGGKLPDKNPLDFFETPAVVVQKMIERARPMYKGAQVLEPSAGEGAIAVPLSGLPVTLCCVELDPERAEALRRRGLTVVEADFLGWRAGPFDRILMNPPFTSKADPLAYIAHIEHAYSLLAVGGGILVAIAPGGFMFRADKRCQSFRSAVEACGGWEELPGESFKGSGTDVSTILLWMVR